MPNKLGWSTKCITGAGVFSDRPAFVEYSVQMAGNGKMRRWDDLKRIRREAKRLQVRESA